MEDFLRYAIYHAPEPGPLADFGAAWLGWDAAAGQERPHPALPGLFRPPAALTAEPRRYGFHATVKPPFRLAEGTDAAALHRAAAAHCAGEPPVLLPGLALRILGGFLALVPEGGEDALSALAARTVAALDGFRAPATEEETARRRPERLTPRQRALLDRWGYPHVMDEFRFHLTLTGPLAAAEAGAVADALAPQIAPLLPRPYAIRSLCLFGQAASGRFRLLHRYTLSG